MSATYPVKCIEGFDFLGLSQLSVGRLGWSGPAGQSTWSMVAGRYGGQRLRFTATADNPSWSATTTVDFPGGTIPNGTGFSMACAFLTTMPGLNNYSVLRLLTSTGATVCAIVLNTSSLFRIDSNTATVATGTHQYQSGTWVHLELVGTVGTSVTLSLYVNGVLECTAAAANCGSAAAARLQTSGSWSGLHNNAVYDLDDIFVIASATQQGDCVVSTLAPAVEGANTAWTLGAGASKVAAVSDASSYDSDTGYLKDTTPGDRETFTVGSLPTGSTTPLAVQLNRVERKEDAATRQTCAVVRAGGTNFDNANTSPGLSLSYNVFADIYDQNPNGPADWSTADFGAGAAEFGVKVVT